MINDWRRVLILVTAFTIGHSITLALVTLDILRVNNKIIEFLIPLTIFITAFSNIFKDEENLGERKIQLNYLYALVFGLIHGMGFSSYLKSILGRHQSIVKPLFAFNLGLELGQIIIVVIFLIVSFIFVKGFTVNRRDWKTVISAMIAGMALILMKERFFW